MFLSRNRNVNQHFPQIKLSYHQGASHEMKDQIGRQMVFSYVGCKCVSKEGRKRTRKNCLKCHKYSTVDIKSVNETEKKRLRLNRNILNHADKTFQNKIEL